MTCFWNGIMGGLNELDFTNLGETKTTNINLIKLLKKVNKQTEQVYWNNQSLRQSELEENFIAVQNYNIDGIQNGHLCSTCDYMLLLICDVFNIDIHHLYLNNTMTYTKPTNQQKLFVQSNKGHFWFVKRV